ncbi:MAG: DNA polymerase III subunit delta [Betaproteobacteria bacterium]|nr:DNA polymerase III subunit delta [Betaproteobacteria bacterium]
MALRPEALIDALARNPAALKTLYALVGDEALLAQEAADALRKAGRAAGYSEREVYTVDPYFDWSGLIGATAAMGLFATRKIVELRMPSGKPGRDGGDALVRWLAALDDSVLALVTLPRPDGATRKSAWYAALESQAVVVACDAVPRHELPRWIAQRLRRNGQGAGDDALQFMADRVEGNLLAAQQEIEKLALLYPAGQLSFEQVEQVVADVARYDVFQLSEATLAADVPRLERMLDGLRAEGESAVLVHYTVAQDIRQLLVCKQAMALGKPVAFALREAGVWGPRQSLFERVLPRLDAQALRPLVRQAAAVDLIVKGLPQPGLPREPWAALHHLALGLMQALQPKLRLALRA